MPTRRGGVPTIRGLATASSTGARRLYRELSLGRLFESEGPQALVEATMPRLVKGATSTLTVPRIHPWLKLYDEERDRLVAAAREPGPVG